MGTSKSYGGAGDKTPLLPDWAQPTNGPEPELNGEGNADDADPNLPVPDLDPIRPNERPLYEQPRSFDWRTAKSSMARVVRSGGGRSDLKAAGRNYVRAKNGARAAARSASLGRTATSNLANFLSSIANRGVAETLENLGLASIIGQPVENVLSAILGVLAPDGADLEGTVARRAADAALLSIFEQYAVEDGGIERLNEMDAESIQDAVLTSVSEYVFQRWMLELGKRVEQGSISPQEAFRLEQLVKDYVYDVVDFDFGNRDVLNTDWRSGDGRRFIEDIYVQAYSLLETIV